MGIECSINGTEIAHAHANSCRRACLYSYLSQIRGEVDAQSYNMQDFVVIEVRLHRQNGKNSIRNFNKDSLMLCSEVGSHHVLDQIGVLWPRPSWISGPSRPGMLQILAQDRDNIAVAVNNVPLGVAQSVRIRYAASSALHDLGKLIQGHAMAEEV